VKIQILDQARDDLLDGFKFYEAQQTGLGSYFLSNLYGDIESLLVYGGIHERPHKDYLRMLSRRFPFAVYYKIVGDVIYIYAVVDCRRAPAWTRQRLG
jgi:hypothetical protein